MPGHDDAQLVWMQVSSAHALLLAVLSGSPTPAQAVAGPSKSGAASEDPSRNSVVADAPSGGSISLVSGTATSELLGPLNAVEQKFAPPRLWTSGEASLLQRHPRVAVVGTRVPSPDGARRARKLVKALVEQRVVVVSGLAQGVDTLAHSQAIELGGRTIAVLGTPLDQVFPRQNEALQRLIAREHLAVSEFAAGVVVSRGNFPRRNRTMALIADASVIIEAGDGSGTLSQGWEALRLGRPLFLLKSLLETDLKWPGEMLEYGAGVLTHIDDLMKVLPGDDIRNAVSF